MKMSLMPPALVVVSALIGRAGYSCAGAALANAATNAATAAELVVPCTTRRYTLITASSPDDFAWNSVHNAAARVGRQDLALTYVPMNLGHPLHVMRGLDPRIHPFRKMMDCRVKPGNDDRENLYQRDVL
jgi:hypothetical protein